MKKTLYILYISIFLIICILPFGGMFLFGESQSGANEILANRPSLTKPPLGEFNTDVLSDTTDYVGDRFAFRQELITMQAGLYASVFQTSISGDVTLGRDGWLFYTDTMDDYLAQDTLSAREVYCAAKSLALMRDYAAEHNVQFLFTVALNKVSLYPEYLKNDGVKVGKKNNRQLLFSALEEQGIPALDLYHIFSETDEILYYRLDSHWNEKGAALAHDALTAELGKTGKAWYNAEYIQSRTHEGDLYNMLYPAGTELDMAFTPAEPFVYQPIGENIRPDNITIQTECSSAEGFLLMFRDSFGNALYPYLANSFARAEFSRSNPYKLYLLENNTYDTVVIEITERNIDWLTTRAPVMPAPERAGIDLKNAEPSHAVVTASVQPVPEMDGYVKISGFIGAMEPNGVKPDTDSDIYIGFSDTVFEASPVGEGGSEYRFTAYVRDHLINEPAQLYFTVNGKTVVSELSFTGTE